MIGELILRCFHARTNAHINHLATDSYAEHKALNDFYDGIVDLVDSLAETYIGEEGELIEFTTKVEYRHVKDSARLIETLKTWIETNRYECCDAENTAQQNIVDEILALCCSTLYKLKFLR